VFRNKGLQYLWIAVFSLLIVLAPSLMAQTSSTGAIKGTITDASNAVVPNATVLATNIGTGATRTSTTGSDGIFVLSLLPLGDYRLKIDAAGFQSQNIPSVTVNVTETTAINAVLQVGSQTTSVTVAETAEAVNTTNATLGTVVASETAVALPLNTRNYTNLLGLSAGASSNVFNATTLGKGTTDIAVNGASVGQNSVFMDGVSITNSSNDGSLASNSGNDPGVGFVEPDAIQEFKIQTSMFDAGYGRNVGASINVVTKSGTNNFHGTAFEFFRNTVLNSNDPFLKAVGKPRPVLNQNQYGGTIGGRIKKDKLFFFTSYQQTWQKNGEAGQGLSNPFFFPIPGTDGIIGDSRGTPGNATDQANLAAALGKVFGGTCGTFGGKTTKNAAGTQIPCTPTGVAFTGTDQYNINPVALNLLQLKNPDGTYLIPSLSASQFAALGCTISGATAAPCQVPLSIPANFTEEQLLQNVDYVINSKNTLSAHYFYAHDPLDSPFGCGKTGAIGTCYPDTNINYVSSNHYLNLQLTSIVSNNVVNVVKAAAIRSWLTAYPVQPFTDTGVGISPIQPAINYLDAITVSSGFVIGATGSVPGEKYFTNLELEDEVSWTHGKHTLRFGGEYERDVANRISQSLGVGSFTFPTFSDFLIGLPGCAATGAACTTSQAAGTTNGTTGSNISSLGNLASLIPPGGLVHSYRAPFADLWVQDDIKLTRKLTVNLGLRWEYDALQADADGLATNIYPSIVNSGSIPGSTFAAGTLAGFVVPSNFPFSQFPMPPVGGLTQSSHLGGEQNNTPVGNFAPRVGFAWSPMDSNKLTVRSGFGVFSDRAGALDYYSGVQQEMPYATPLFGSNYQASLGTPYILPPSPWTPRYVNFTTPSQSSNLAGTFASPNYNRTPVVYQWNMTVQYQFLPTWTLELGYVGSRGIHQEGVANIPGATGQMNPNGAYLVGTPSGALAPAIAAGLVTTNTAANAPLRTPMLGFASNGFFEFINNEGTKFSGAQATVRKQVSHGVTFQVAYSFSRSFGTTDVFNDPHTDQYVRNASYHPQRLAINYEWQIPATYQGFVGKVTNGWAVSGVTVLQDGVPLSIQNSLGGSVYGFGAVGASQFSTAEYCAGYGPGSEASAGSTKQRLGNWFNNAAIGIGCTIPSPVVPGVTTTGTGWGNVGPSAILGPGQFNWDMSIIKTTKVGGIREDATLVFRTEFFNAFNHAQFSNPGSFDVNAGASFGKITSASVNPRLIQFGLKYIF